MPDKRIQDRSISLKDEGRAGEASVRVKITICSRFVLSAGIVIAGLLGLSLTSGESGKVLAGFSLEAFASSQPDMSLPVGRVLSGAAGEQDVTEHRTSCPSLFGPSRYRAPQGASWYLGV